MQRKLQNDTFIIRTLNNAMIVAKKYICTTICTLEMQFMHLFSLNNGHAFLMRSYLCCHNSAAAIQTAPLNCTIILPLNQIEEQYIGLAFYMPSFELANKLREWTITLKVTLTECWARMFLHMHLSFLLHDHMLLQPLQINSLFFFTYKQTDVLFFLASCHQTHY